MAKIKSLEELLVHELQDLHSAETQLVEALPLMAEAVQNPRVKRAFNDHLKQTKGQVTRLNKALKLMGEEPGEEKCKGMDGLIREGKAAIKNTSDPDTLDAALIGAAQKVEHYEISGYGTARTFAQQLGQNEVAELLSATLEEESAANELLTDIAMAGVNVQAIA
mgnify:FL=1